MYSGKFAQYYDIIYGKKNYQKEVNLLQELIGDYDTLGVREPVTVVDIGCGTGTHSLLMAQNPTYDITGVEPSRDMIYWAWDKLDETITNCRFRKGYLREVINSCNKTKFDVALSMFFVLNQMETCIQLGQFGEDLARVVKPGGLLIFDCWNYDQVLIDPPRSENLSYDVKSHSVTVDYSSSLVDSVVSMNMDIGIADNNTGCHDSFQHLIQLKMWPTDHLLKWLDKSGFDLLECCAAYDRVIHPNTAYKNVYVARKREE